VPPTDEVTVLCELCRARIPTSRRNAKRDRFDHAADYHRAALLAVPAADRSNYIHRMFRITNRLGRRERLPV
jgi:hypothetical protein